MLCSEWVPSEWESDKNITIIHTTPVHQLTSGEDKRWNKSIIKTFLTNCCCLSHQNPVTYLLRAVLSCNRCLIWCRFLSWFRPEHFFTEESYYGLWDSMVFELKNISMMDLFQLSLLKMLTDGLEWCGLLLMFYQTLILTAPISLQSIHCWDTDAVMHFYKSDEETNTS